MVKTYNCSCNRNMYLWWCSNVIQIKISEFYLEILLLCLSWVQPWDIWQRNVQPGVGKFGCIWLEWCALGQGIWLQIFECQIPTPCPAPPPPPPPLWLYIDRCINIVVLYQFLVAYIRLTCEVSRTEKRFKIAIKFSGRRRRSREERNGFLKADIVK